MIVGVDNLEFEVTEQKQQNKNKIESLFTSSMSNLKAQSKIFLLR